MTEINPCPVCGKAPEVRCDVEGYCWISCATSHVETMRVIARNTTETIRAWNSLSAPTDRRCGTCAHWEVDNSSDDHIRRCEGESEKFGTCMALPMVPETQNTALAESFGDRCAMWDLRGAE